MFNVGGAEVLVILLVALLVLGPGKLPDAARQVGKVLTQMRQMSSGFQNELKSALDATIDPPTTTSPPPADSGRSAATAEASNDDDATGDHGEASDTDGATDS